jgi:alpha-beta hydrolase superfamily lysophospholipase
VIHSDIRQRLTFKVNDSHAIIQYVRKQAPHKEIYVWGHSMGSGVATRVVAELRYKILA